MFNSGFKFLCGKCGWSCQAKSTILWCPPPLPSRKICEVESTKRRDSHSNKCNKNLEERWRDLAFSKYILFTYTDQISLAWKVSAAPLPPPSLTLKRFVPIPHKGEPARYDKTTNEIKKEDGLEKSQGSFPKLLLLLFCFLRSPSCYFSIIYLHPADEKENRST